MSVGVVMPKEAPTGTNTFELCQGGKCVEAGTIGTFGAISKSRFVAENSGSPQVDDKKYFLRDTDVTDVVDKQGWTLKKPFVARMTKSVVGNLPDPVVILHQLGEEGDLDTEKTSVTLSPREEVGHYGNLIKGYPIKNKSNKKNIEEPGSG